MKRSPFAAMPRLAVTVLAAGPPAPGDVDGGFPLPLWLAFVAVALCGAAGAFAADLVSDGGRIERPARTDTGWVLGWPGKLMVGAVAALVTLVLNPPDRAWATLLGTALTAGAGGEALLLALAARRKADAAEHDRDRAQEQVRVIMRTSHEQIEAARQSVLAAYQTHVEAPPGHSDGGVRDRFEGSVNSAFAQARRALAAVLGPTSLWEQVRGILARRLGRRDFDGQQLGELADARLRHLLADDIARCWPHLSPPWKVDDLPPDVTLASIVNEIDGRTP
jgi:hypothetical protein